MTDIAWYEHYNYDNQQELILKLCKKFNISYPNVRYNCFGQTDVTFIQGLYEYLVELDIKNENFIIKRKNNKSNGYKSNKNYKNFEYINPTAASVMSVFWPTVSCLYLCISFLTFEWHVTWIIWLVAALIYNVLKSFLCK